MLMATTRGSLKAPGRPRTAVRVGSGAAITVPAEVERESLRASRRVPADIEKYEEILPTP